MGAVENPSETLKKHRTSQKTSRFSIYIAVFFFLVGLLAVGWSYNRITKLQEQYDLKTKDLKQANDALSRKVQGIQSHLDESQEEINELKSLMNQLKLKVKGLFQQRRVLSDDYKEALLREENLSASLLDMTTEMLNLRDETQKTDIMPLDDRLLLEMENVEDEGLKEFLAYTIENILKIKGGEAITLKPIVLETEPVTPAPQPLYSSPLAAAAPPQSASPPAEVISPLAKQVPLANALTHITSEIVKLDKRYDLIVVNRGLDDGIVEGMVGDIISGGETIAQVEIINTRNKLAAAFIRATKHKDLIAENKEVRFKRIYD